MKQNYKRVTIWWKLYYTLLEIGQVTVIFPENDVKSTNQKRCTVELNTQHKKVGGTTSLKPTYYRKRS